ncbi:hypothetical protein E2C01_063740 [Portunus trituberculatus]|uniref:Uncharacterized protein n=1 Tax=Portunus trituberculatus TaxID=210409 RepID=A0A5B7HLR1_PORTR|nr:hypothetical protein [Portunus trituberculatus]
MDLEYFVLPGGVTLEETTDIGWEVLEDSRRKCWKTYDKVVFWFTSCIVSSSIFFLGVMLAPLVKSIVKLIG